MRIGDRVFFGRTFGEQSLGEVIKVNSKTVKVKLLEARGSGRGSFPGSVWNVAKTLCRPAEGSGPSTSALAPVSPVAASGSALERALAKLTIEETRVLEIHFRKGYIPASMF